MPNYFNFDPLTYRLNFTPVQCAKLYEHTQYTPQAYYLAFNTLVAVKTYHALTSDIISVCIDALLDEDEQPEYLALIISDLAEMEILTTSERSQLHLSRIKTCPIKEVLHIGLAWINLLGLPAEMIHYYLLPDDDFPRQGHVLFQNISMHFGKIMATEPHQRYAINSLIKLLKHAVGLPYDDHIQLVHDILSHPSITELDSAFRILADTMLFSPFTNSSKHCLDTVLHDQYTPEATAKILILILSPPIFKSEKLTQLYCDKVRRYPDKSCLITLTIELKNKHAWPSKHIEAGILQILGIRKAVPQINIYATQYLSTLAYMKNIISEDIYTLIMPLLQPQTLANFLNLMSLLHTTDSRLEYYLDRMVCRKNILTQRLQTHGLLTAIPIARLYYEILELFTYALGDNLKRHLPSSLPLTQKIYESTGHAHYCGHVMRTSHLFFCQPKKIADFVEQDALEHDAESQATAINSA